jgi:hypothetical protein
VSEGGIVAKAINGEDRPEPAKPSPAEPPARDKPRGATRGMTKGVATKLVFALALLCLLIVGYAAVAYIHLSYAEPSTTDISLFIVRQRTTLSALAMCIAVSCVVMGVALFIMGAKGEINFSAENGWFKGALAVAVPGPFFVLCGTIITMGVLNAKVEHDGGWISGAFVQPDPKKPSTEPIPVVGGRTIASPRRQVLYVVDRGTYNSLFEFIEDPVPDDALTNLADRIGSINVVQCEWDDASDRPANDHLYTADNQVLSFAGGFTVVPPRDEAGLLVKSVVQAWDAAGRPTDASNGLSAVVATKQVAAALKGSKFFSRGVRY